MPRKERVIVSAHIPLSLRRTLEVHADESERTLSGEIRRGLAFYAEREYGRASQHTDQGLATSMPV